MSVVRVNKNQNYTVMSNYHLRDRSISLKAKGLLSVMLSLPDDWDYSISGLASICGEGETAIKSALKELNYGGYVKVDKLYPNQTDSGKIEYNYNVFEEPDMSRVYSGKTASDNVVNLTQIRKQEGEKQGVEVLHLENKAVEINPLLNTYTNYEIQNTDENNIIAENQVFDVLGDETVRPKIRYQSIVDKYNEICTSLPKVTKVSNKRKEAIGARFRSGYTEEDFLRAFKMASESKFLCGANKDNWIADFDWIICDSNMAKVLDGKYSDERGKKVELGNIRDSKGSSRWNLQSAVD